MMLSAHDIARRMGGEASGNQAAVPGPGHSPKDRSLAIRVTPDAPDGFVVHSHAGDDAITCKDYVRARCGLEGFPANRKASADLSIATEGTRQQVGQLVPPVISTDDRRRKLEMAQSLWRRRQPAAGSIVETYLRQTRGYQGPIPATIGFLPARGSHAPAMIAAFGIPEEPEPGKLAIDGDIKGIHLTRLKPDGSGKAGTACDKIMLGSSTGAPIVLAPMNDLLGLVICEGIETGLSLVEAMGCGVWAAGSAGRMVSLADAIPNCADCVTVIAEADEAGQKGAADLAAKLDERGIYQERRFLETDART